MGRRVGRELELAYTELASRLMRYFQLQGLRPETAEDMTQETLYRMLVGWSTFRRDAALSTWAFAIARRLLADHYRRQERESRLRAAQAINSSPPTPEEALVAREAEQGARQALSGLSNDDRSVLIWREHEAMSYQEISQLTGWPLGVVKVRLFRARKRLAQAYQRLMKGAGERCHAP